MKSRIVAGTRLWPRLAGFTVASAFFMAGCAGVSPNRHYIDLYAKQRVAVVAFNANAAIEEPENSGGGKGISLGNIQAGFHGVRALAQGGSLSAALDSMSHNMKGVNDSVARDAERQIRELDLFRLLPQKQVLENPDYRSLKSGGWLSMGTIGPEGWKILTQFDLKKNVETWSKLGADALLLFANNYGWEKRGRGLISEDIGAGVRVSMIMAAPDGNILLMDDTVMKSVNTIGMISGAYDRAAMNALLVETAHRAYGAMFGRLDALFKRAVRSDSTYADSVLSRARKRQPVDSAMADSETAGAIRDTLSTSATDSAPATRAQSLTSSVDAGPEGSADSTQEDGRTVILDEEDEEDSLGTSETGGALEPTPHRNDVPELPDSLAADAPVESRGMLMFYAHPVSFAFSGSGGLTSRSIWATIETSPVRKWSRIVTLGWLPGLDSTVRILSDGEIRFSARRFELGVGGRRYLKDPQKGFFYQLTGMVRTSSLLFERFSGDALACDRSVNEIAGAFKGCLGAKWRRGRYTCFFDIGGGYEFSYYTEGAVSVTLGEASGKESIPLKSYRPFQDIDLGVGIEF